jgi:hypothetical protein
MQLQNGKCSHLNAISRLNHPAPMKITKSAGTTGKHGVIIAKLVGDAEN